MASEHQSTFRYYMEVSTDQGLRALYGVRSFINLFTTAHGSNTSRNSCGCARGIDFVCSSYVRNFSLLLYISLSHTHKHTKGNTQRR